MGITSDREDPGLQKVDPATGLQENYLVLSEAERLKGFERPYRESYKHQKCNHVTSMNRAIAETYARDPHFYGATYCGNCREHFPVGEEGEFVWIEADGSEGPKVGT